MTKKKAPGKSAVLRKSARQLRRRLTGNRIGLAVADPDIAQDLLSIFRDAGFSVDRDARTGIIRLTAPNVTGDQLVRQMDRARRTYAYRHSGRLEP